MNIQINTQKHTQWCEAQTTEKRTWLTPGIRILETGGDTMNSVQSNNFECFHWSIYNFCTLHTAEHSSPCSIVECSALCSVHKFKIIIRDRPFNLKEEGAWFFPKCPPLFLCPYSGIFFLSMNSFLKPLSPYFPLPCSALDWTWGKGRKDVCIQYITKFTKVQSHASFKILELVKSNSANGIIRTSDWLTCRLKEVFYDHDHCPFVNIYCKASYDG